MSPPVEKLEIPKEDLTVCGQKGCTEKTAYLFTWPGYDMAGICEDHSGKLKATAAALGLYLQLIPVLPTTEEE